MGYSSNGKYLAFCAEEKRDPDVLSECDKENRKPHESAPKQNPKMELSRRQRKNRQRKDVSSDAKKKLKAVEKKAFAPLPEYTKLNISENTFVLLLHPHILTREQMESMGYPIWAGPNWVFFDYFDYNRSKRAGLNVNAREFVPRQMPSDRSSKSSDTDDSSGSDEDSTTLGVQRTCVRCGKGFFVTETEYLTRETCSYHPGRLQNLPAGYHNGSYTCCGGAPDSDPCASCKLHVWNGAVGGRNYRSGGFVRTEERMVDYRKVYALDCEMSYTVAGLEVTKVSVVRMNGWPVYESFVRPPTPIVDYNTRYSGIRPEDLLPANSKTLEEVQNDLLGFIFADTILIGHGLENDLRALKMVHGCVVDTVSSFPHFSPPCKHSLRWLVANYLHRTVQCDANGHDSCEDASACMELMLYRVRVESKRYVRN